MTERAVCFERTNQVYVLGSRVHLASMQDTLDVMQVWIESGERRCRRVTVTGFHGLWEAHKDAVLREILNSAELWVPDGIAPVWVARLKGHGRVARVSGAEIMQGFFERANLQGYSSYFYGDTEETLGALRRTLEARHPGHRVVGTYSPPFRALTPEEDEAIVERINAAKPDVLWVGLGMPKQDRWIYERRHRLKVPVAVGVGAAFAFVARTVQRCPEWMGRWGVEWVYRFLREPKKLWRRDLIDGPCFLVQVGKELLRGGKDDE
jgi:N-acetylglucosaminyldiphosphoundecaprenol N-acetyl-beta-D-mannosaminyltransferase